MPQDQGLPQTGDSQEIGQVVRRHVNALSRKDALVSGEFGASSWSADTPHRLPSMRRAL